MNTMLLPKRLPIWTAILFSAVLVTETPALAGSIPGSTGQFGLRNRRQLYPTSARPRAGASGMLANSQHIARELHATKLQLERANHDYNGHRARAIHEIDVALNALGHRTVRTTTARRGASNNARMAHHEPQGNSDVQLRQAQQRLVAIESRIGSTQGNGHARAHLAVQKAVGELNTALQIR